MDGFLPIQWILKIEINGGLVLGRGLKSSNSGDPREARLVQTILGRPAPDVNLSSHFVTFVRDRVEKNLCHLRKCHKSSDSREEASVISVCV
jgi:hypothetical protein